MSAIILEVNIISNHRDGQNFTKKKHGLSIFVISSDKKSLFMDKNIHTLQYIIIHVCILNIFCLQPPLCLHHDSVLKTTYKR